MKRYEVLFFDLDHTLIDTRRQYALGLAEALQKTYPQGYPTDFPVHFMNHHQRLWAEYDARRLPMEEVRRQRFILAWQDYGVARTVAEADAFYQTYTRTLDRTLFPYENVVDMLDELQERYRLAIITNGSPDLQWRKMGITGLQTYFPEDTLIISEVVGKAKPDPSVFQFACDVLQVSKENALMLGDNYEKDVLGARAFGMDALWVIPDPEMADEARRMGVNDVVFTNLLEVRPAIERLEAER